MTKIFYSNIRTRCSTYTVNFNARSKFPSELIVCNLLIITNVPEQKILSKFPPANDRVQFEEKETMFTLCYKCDVFSKMVRYKIFAFQLRRAGLVTGFRSDF